MKERIRVLWLAIAVGLLAVAGLAVADDFPEGCVSCHGQTSSEADFRLNALLTQIGHRWIKTLKEIPEDCGKCHSGDDQEKTFMAMTHEIHYDVPKANLFTTRYGGECLHCHSMNVETGEAALKGGPKNW